MNKCFEVQNYEDLRASVILNRCRYLAITTRLVVSGEKSWTSRKRRPQPHCLQNRLVVLMQKENIWTSIVAENFDVDLDAIDGGARVDSALSIQI